jgi:UDP-N-acetyl-D-glucosamine dehydrogenase
MKNNSHTAFLDRIQQRSAHVGVIGLGYVGLPLVREFCRGGFQVTGFDVDEAKVKALTSGRSYIKHIPSSMVRDMLETGRFAATTDMSRLSEPDAIIICVPTPLTRTKDPDLQFVENTARAIARTLRPGQLVSLESTTYPGTTRDVVKPILEAAGLKAEKDFWLAFSPEREDPGRKDHSTRTIPKLVGGIGPRSLAIAHALYGAVVEKAVAVESCEVAEAAKVVENVYRCVNIALVNELKIIFDAMGIDVWQVIAAASTKPFGFQAFYPGPGLGGHCIPIDPFYLSWKAKEYEQSAKFIELAGQINTSMPEYVMEKVVRAVNDAGKSIKGAKVLVLGLAYKKDVDDLRESPSVVLIEMLKKRGAKVDYNDPFIPKTHRQREHDLRMTSKNLDEKTLASYDCVLIATDHSCYDYDFIVKHARLVVDSRNATAGVKAGRGKIVKA